MRVSANTAYSITATSDRALQARFVEEKSIPNNHSPWAEPYLQRIIALGLIPDSLLSQQTDYTQPITREEFAGVVVKAYEALANTAALPATANPFTDTNSIDVLKAYNTGLMVGRSETQFDPHTLLDRESAATALSRVFKRATIPMWTFATDSDYPLLFVQPAPFADDADISAWAREGVYFMVASGIIQGFGNNTFAPRNVTSEQESQGYATATREQALIIALGLVEKLGT